MTTRFVALLIVSLAACPPSAKGAVQPRATARTLQPAAQQQADLVVRCVAQKTLPPGLTATQRTALSRVAADLRSGQVEVAKSRWSRFVSEIAKGGGAYDPNALVQWLLREAYLEQTQDLRFYADKVRFYNEAKESLRNHLDLAKGLQARGAARTPVRVIQLRAYSKDAQPIAPAATRPMTKSELQGHIAEMEEKLNSIGDDAQLANVDLQNILQKNQQTMQTMSNIMKKLEEVQRSIIQNMK